MVALVAVGLTVAALLNLPAWWYARRTRGASWALPVLGAPSLVVWLALVVAGVGAQSLSNLVEVAWLLVASVPACYAQVFILDRLTQRPRANTLGMAVVLCIVAVALRLLMPALPE